MRFSSRLGLPALTLPLVFGLTGCGLVTSDDPTIVPGTGVRDGDPNENPKLTDIDEPPVVGLPLEGSFDLRFLSVVRSLQGGQGGPVLDGDAPSKTTALRVDIAADGTKGYRAVVTPRWGRPATVDVILGQDKKSLVLVGDVSVTKAHVDDRWKTLTLGLRTDGTLSGEVTASGEQSMSQGDVLSMQNLIGEGTIARDETAPEVRANLASRLGPVDALLPWDELIVDAAEPLDAAELVENTVFATSSGVLAVNWQPTSAEDAPSLWVGATRRIARAKTWPSLVSGWAASTSAPLVDRVGLATDAGQLRTFQFLALPSASSDIDFDSDVIQVSFWGNTELLGGGFLGTDDPRCEAGGCVKMNFPHGTGCTPVRAGMAGKLVRSGQVKVRYRVFAANSWDPPTSGAPYLFGVPVTIEAATEGGDVVSKYVTPTSADLVHLAAPVDGYAWATPWTTATLSAPSGTGAVGFAVSAQNPTACISTGGGPVPALDLMVLVEGVTN